MPQRRAALVVVMLAGLALGSGSRPSVRAQSVSAWHECACPGLRINEFLPEPHYVDWNGDGQPSFQDQWVELYNAGPASCNLQAWVLRGRGPSGTWPYTCATPISLSPDGYYVLYRGTTTFRLSSIGGSVELLHPDGTLHDVSFTYPSYTVPDQSWSLCPSGLTWDCTYSPSPGWANGMARPVYLPLVGAD